MSPTEQIALQFTIPSTTINITLDYLHRPTQFSVISSQLSPIGHETPYQVSSAQFPRFKQSQRHEQIFCIKYRGVEGSNASEGWWDILKNLEKYSSECVVWFQEGCVKWSAMIGVCCYKNRCNLERAHAFKQSKQFVAD